MMLARTLTISDDSGLWVVLPFLVFAAIAIAFYAGSEWRKAQPLGDPEYLTCPACRGDRGANQFLGPDDNWDWVPCTRCSGEGMLLAEMAITSGYPIGYVRHAAGEVRFRPHSLFLDPPEPPWRPVYSTKDIAP